MVSEFSLIFFDELTSVERIFDFFFPPLRTSERKHRRHCSKKKGENQFPLTKRRGGVPCRFLRLNSYHEMQQAAAALLAAAASSSSIGVGASRAGGGGSAANSTTPAVPHAANSLRPRGTIAVASGGSSRSLRALSPPRAAPDTAAAREQRSAGRVQRGAPRKLSSNSDAPSSSSRRSRDEGDRSAVAGRDDAADDLSSAFARLRPVGPPPVFPSAAPTGSGLDGGIRQGRIGDYAAAVVAAGFLPGDERADPRLVKPALHPSNLVRGNGGSGNSASSAADVAAAEREMEAMAGFGEDEELLDEIDGIASSRSRKRKRKRREAARRGGASDGRLGQRARRARHPRRRPRRRAGRRHRQLCRLYEDGR